MLNKLSMFVIGLITLAIPATIIYLLSQYKNVFIIALLGVVVILLIVLCYLVGSLVWDLLRDKF
ncbi:hypothetical protein CWO92_07010 [Heyndrickxia camelliae]|uniref:Uncharacterized protein n=1 Tax=Heyndrickxia camelliae TaxID=1707093 RepID=A0A2N3LNF3_9BACI|nr:hypothetical protein CWO92_07010 [Heyndrickxia camelliae]